MVGTFIKFKKFIVFLYIACIRQQMQENKVQLRENEGELHTCD